MEYTNMIRKARLFKQEDIDSTTSTEDADYNGTALEIFEKNGHELFHVVVDDEGERQILFFPSKEYYRMPIELMEKIIARAKEVVYQC
jgi:hypothetical protein